MRENNLIIGTRGSELALWQTNFVKAKLAEIFPEINLEIKIIKTTGDKLLNVALSKIGDKGLFTKQIEDELLNDEIDLAVHSLKDLPTVQPEGLKIGAVLEREMSNDVLIAKKHLSLADLPPNARVATGSLRRKSQLLNYRSDLQTLEIRGNVPTRISKFEETDLDAIILAFAGIHRLNLDAYISQIIPFEIMLPAAGQGAIAVEIHADNFRLEEILQKLNDENTEVCVKAERSFLHSLEGGCQIPVGANAVLQNDKIYLAGMVGNLDGSVNLRDQISGEKLQAEDLGKRLAQILLEKGADKLLEQSHRTLEKVEDEII